MSGWMIAKRNVEFAPMFVKKRFKQLIIPYFSCSVIYIMWEIVVNKEGIIETIYLLYQTLCFRGMAPLWFLPSLFVAEVIMVFLITKGSKTLIFILLAVYLLNGLVYSGLELQNLGGIVSNPIIFFLRTSMCTVFLGCGCICNETLKK